MHDTYTQSSSSVNPINDGNGGNPSVSHPNLAKKKNRKTGSDSPCSQDPKSPELLARRQRFKELNEVIDGGLTNFIEVGSALAEVRDSKLYLLDYPKWDAYLERKWGIKRSYASLLIRGSTVAKEIESRLTGVNFTKPTVEAQVRPLLHLKDPEERLRAWKDAHSTHPGEAPTKDEVTISVQKLLPLDGKASKCAKESNQTPVVPAPKKPSGDLPEAETAPELVDVTMADGTIREQALVKSEYIDPLLAQDLLNKVRNKVPGSIGQVLEFQDVLLRYLGGLNSLVDKDPCKDTRDAVKEFGEVISKVPLLAAKPGDMEPKRATEGTEA